MDGEACKRLHLRLPGAKNFPSFMRLCTRVFGAGPRRLDGFCGECVRVLAEFLQFSTRQGQNICFFMKQAFRDWGEALL